MHIITWNVNGIRAALGKGSLDWVFEQNPDIICLQEVKARYEQLSEADQKALAGWNLTWHPAEKAGYSGVASLSRSLPVHTSTGAGENWRDSEGRVICIEINNYAIFNVYFPNGQRDQGRLDYKLDYYSNMLDLCINKVESGMQVIICGDFNTAHQPIDLKNWRQNEKVSGFLPVEREWIDRYIQSNFVDVYRFKYPQRIQYTWWTYIGGARARNVGWRLDYFLVSADAIKNVQDVVIHDEVIGSDHCPVSLFID